LFKNDQKRSKVIKTGATRVQIRQKARKKI